MKLFIFVLFFLFLNTLFHPIFAQEAPWLPMIVEGKITIDKKPAPAGTLITANIDGTIRAQYTLLEDGNYLLTIPGDETDEGKIISFYINGIDTNKTLTWKSGNITENFDFTIYTEAPVNILPFVMMGVVVVGGITFLSYKKLKLKFKKRGRKTVSSLVSKNYIPVLFFLLYLVPVAHAQVPVVNTFTGTATIINSLGLVNTSGMNISAYIDETLKASYIINDELEYVLVISGTSEDDGKTITFTINGIPTDQNETFVYEMRSVSINLTATDTNLPIVTIDPVTTPTNVSTQTISGSFIEDNLDKIYVNGIEATIVGNSYISEVSLDEGLNTINVTAIDLAKNVETSTTTIVLDTKKPTVSDDAPTGWQTSKPVTITLTWDDPTPSSGKAWIKYCIDSDNTCIPDTDYDENDKPQISLEGIRYFRYQSKDNAGNIQDIVSRIIQIDTVSPSISNVKLNQTFGPPGIVININATVTDATSGVSSVKVDIKGPDERNIILQKVDDIYTGIWDTRDAREGMYLLTVVAEDNAGNSKELKNVGTIALSSGAEGTYANNTISINANETLTIDAREETDVVLEVTTNETVSGSINIAVYNSTTVSDPTGVIALNKYIEIETTQEIKNALSWVLIKIYYTDDEISGIDESSLRIYYYNETSGLWTPYNPPYGGVNEDENYVYANSTHFSLYGIYGDAIAVTPAPTPVPTPTPAGIRSITIISLDSIPITAGSSGSLTLTVSNTGSFSETEVRITFSGVPLTWITITPTSANIPAWESQEYTVTITVPSDESGTRTITFTATSKEGTTASKVVELLIITPPSVITPPAPPTELLIVINDDANVTNTTLVTLTLSANNADECRYSNDNLTWSDYETYTTLKEWNLTAGDGIKTVYYQCRNDAGESIVVSDTIELITPVARAPSLLAVITGAVVAVITTPAYALILTLMIILTVLTTFRVKFLTKMKKIKEVLRKRK